MTLKSVPLPSKSEHMTYEQLKLDNQLCFPVYAASRLIIRQYQPHLDELGITYPQYLVLMVLWENNEIAVSDITNRLILNTNTITPLLKRLEIMGIITRHRSTEDERKVIVCLTEKGDELRHKASRIPQQLVDGLKQEALPLQELIELKQKLDKLIHYLKTDNNETLKTDY